MGALGLWDRAFLRVGSSGMPVEDDNAKYNTLLRIVNFVPPMVVMGIIALPYYIYVFINCEILLEDEAPGPMFGVMCLIIHHIVVFFLLWSFAMSIIVDPGRVPEWYARLEMERQGMHVPGKFLAIDDEEYKLFANDAQGGSIEKKLDGSGRWCRKCVKVKPDRCHHCRVCQRCVLKMDHHCPWINNCVGYYNYKYFYLFITYALLILFSVALGGFVTFHTYLLLQNFTTIELVEKKGSPARGKSYVHPWDRKARQNIEESLGTNPMLWMIPTRIGMRGNGVRFTASDEYRSIMRTSK